MIAIVDYGLGNVRAFLNVYKRLNIEARATKKPEDLKNATKIVLPGVGAFDHAIRLLETSGMRPALQEAALERGIPILGVCVGMQILAESSDEGVERGLNWIPGRVRAFDSMPGSSRQPVPHMGWNDVKPVASTELFRGLESGARFYFLHSFFFDCSRSEHIAATASYGIEFACAVSAGNIHGVQFHPEKSHQSGATVLKNFAGI